MNIKSILCCAAVSASAMLVASDIPEVENVTMVQQSPGRLITVTYDLVNAPNGAVVTLDVQTNRTGAVTNNDDDWVSIGGEAVCNAKGEVWKKVAQGVGKTILWRPDKSWEGHKITLADGGARARVTAWPLDNTPDYMVVDISAAAQPNTQRYYPAADFIPGGLFGRPEYRTTMLVMRKIMAKDVTWTMGSTTLEEQRDSDEATHEVTLTNNYYIGVFPVTQTQWGLVQTSNPMPSLFNNAADRAMRPVERVSYNEIRNNNSVENNSAYNWPHDPNPDSFLGLLRTKTGIDFDLPSEAQWEFMSRAGNGNTKWGDGSAILNMDTDANLNLYGRYGYNTDITVASSSADASTRAADGGTAIVGSYAPNKWGLYDTAGNVWEWCLDWYASDIKSLNGAVNANSGGNRVNRGGSMLGVAKLCRPAKRNSSSAGYQGKNIGFRVACRAGLQ